MRELSKFSSAFAAALSAMSAPKPSRRNPGRGVARAERRLLKHRAFREANTPENCDVHTRQRDRAEMRRLNKEMRSTRKADAMQRGYPGGAATIT